MPTAKAVPPLGPMAQRMAGSAGSRTSGNRLRQMLKETSERLDVQARQRKKAERILAARRRLARGLSDDTVLDLTTTSPPPPPPRAPPDELVSDDDDDDFTPSPAPPRPRPSAYASLSGGRVLPPRQPPRPWGDGDVVHISSGDEAPVPPRRSRLKKKRTCPDVSKRVRVPVSSFAFAPESPPMPPPRPTAASPRKRRRPLVDVANTPPRSLAKHEKLPREDAPAPSVKDYHGPRDKKDDKSDTQEGRTSNDGKQPGRRAVPNRFAIRRESLDTRPFELRITALSPPEILHIEDAVEETTLDGSGPDADDDAFEVNSTIPRAIPTHSFYGKPAKENGARKRERRSVRVMPRRSRCTTQPIPELSDEGDEEPLQTSPSDIRFRPPTHKELDIIKALTFKVPKKTVMARIEAANIDLKAEDFGGLRGSRWLNDEIINAFVALINARNASYWNGVKVKKAAAARDSEVEEICTKPRSPTPGPVKPIFERPRPRVHMFNTFFFARLSQNNQYDYDGVRRWLKRTGKCAVDLDLIMFPINLSNFHWVLAAIDMRAQQFLYLDSTSGGDSSGVLSMLRDWLHDEVIDKSGEQAARDMDIRSWGEVINPHYLPKQHDGGSCGVFTLYMAEYLERAKKPSFEQKNIRNLRWRTALFLKNSDLPDT